jgi:hypothetical protein
VVFGLILEFLRALCVFAVKKEFLPQRRKERKEVKRLMILSSEWEQRMMGFRGAEFPGGFVGN